MATQAYQGLDLDCLDPDPHGDMEVKCRKWIQLDPHRNIAFVEIFTVPEQWYKYATVPNQEWSLLGGGGGSHRAWTETPMDKV